MGSADYPVSQIQLGIQNRRLEIHPVVPVKAMTVFDLSLVGKMFSDLKQAPLGPALRILKYKYLERSFYVELLHFGNKD